MAKKSDKDKQIGMFQQKRVPQIEEAYLAADEKRAEIEAAEKIVKDLEDQLDPLEKTLRETVHAFEDRVDHQQTASGDPILVYERNEFKIEIKTHERMSYAKVRPRAADTPAEDAS